MAVTGRPISLLGRVAVGVTAPRGRRVELVFAYLAAEHQRMVSHDELADALWPAGLPDTWEAGLRGVLTEVRRYLADCGLAPDAELATGRRGYQLRLPDEVTVDVDDARDGLTAARALLAEGSAVPAAERAGAAASLATLPFLPDHEGEWADGIRRELATIAGRALEIEARALATLGEAGASAAVAERLVLLEPFNEAAHQLRIRLLGEAGDRAGAVRAYEHCRAVLAEELGIEPSEETAAVFRAATDPAAPHRAEAAADEQAGAFDRLTVLVVEDHDFQRRVAVMLLRRLGIGDVLEAADGGAALDLLAGGATPDVVVCDLDMPGIDGMEFIRQVAAEKLAGAVIIASGLDAKVINAVRSVSESFGLQVLGAVEKPLTERCLADLLLAYRPGERRVPGSGDAVRGRGRRSRDPRRAHHLPPATGRRRRDGRGRRRPCSSPAGSSLAAPRWRPPTSWRLSSRPAPSARSATGPQPPRGAHLRALEASGIDVPISVGIVADHLHDASFADRATDGTDPSRLTFSLAEADFRASPGAALGLLTRLRVKGCGVALDGFGAGHAPDDLVRGAAAHRGAPRPVPRPVRCGGCPPAWRPSPTRSTRRAGSTSSWWATGPMTTPPSSSSSAWAATACSATASPPPCRETELAGWTATWDPSLLVVGGAT